MTVNFCARTVLSNKCEWMWLEMNNLISRIKLIILLCSSIHTKTKTSNRVALRNVRYDQKCTHLGIYYILVYILIKTALKLIFKLVRCRTEKPGCHAFD